MSISQSDIILIKALREGINYLREFPYHLDFIFEDARQDLVAQEFGNKEIDAAKRWFLNTNIPILSIYRIDKPIFPCVTVQVKSSVEDKEHAGLGDSAFASEEDVTESPYIEVPRFILGPFTPSYNLTTGEVTLPVGLDSSLVFPGQGIMSKASGNTYLINRLGPGNGFTIDPGIRDNFTDSYVVPANRTLRVTRGHAHFHEDYEISCYVAGTPGELYWLHSVVSYILLQRRQYLLEKFNMGITSIATGPIQKEIDETTENFFMKTINMDGNVEVTWVDSIDEKIEGIIPKIISTVNEDTNIDEVNQT